MQVNHAPDKQALHQGVMPVTAFRAGVEALEGSTAEDRKRLAVCHQNPYLPLAFLDS